MAVNIDFDELRPLLERHVSSIPAAVRAAVERSLFEAINYVTLTHLSHAKSGPTQPGGLRVQSGHARQSVQQSADLTPTLNAVTGRFGSRLRYVRAHELGFQGKVQVPAHTRRLVSLKRGNTGTVTKKSAKEYKRAVTAGRKTTAHVRAHSRQVNMIARKFFADTIKRIGPDVPRYVLSALRRLATTGTIPRPQEL